MLGGDIETSPNDIVVKLEHKLAIENVEWSKLTDPQWDSQTSSWVAPFHTTIETLTGNYTFKTRLRDGDEAWTEYLSPETELKVLNNPPVAKHNFETDIFEANEKTPKQSW